MDNSQTIIALIGSITSVITSVVAGYYAIRVAQIEQKRIKGKAAPSKSGTDQSKADSSLSLGIWIWLLVLVPLTFFIALLGNWISGTPNELLIADSIDTAILSPLFFLISYSMSARLFPEKTNVRRILIPSIIIGLLFLPFIYLLSLGLGFLISPEVFGFQLDIDSQNSSVNFNFNIGAPFDGAILGTLAVIAGFLLGASKKNIVLSLK